MSKIISITTVESIIAAIGGEIDKEFESHWQTKFRYEDLDFLVSKSGNKYSIGLFGPRFRNDVAYNKSDEYERHNVQRSIGISVNRAPEDAARDFKRRIDITGIKHWLELRKVDETAHDDEVRRSLNYATVVAGVAGGKVTSSSSDSHTIDVNGGGKWYSTSGLIRLQGDTAHFDIRGVTDIDLIRDLAAVLGKHRKK